MARPPACFRLSLLHNPPPPSPSPLTGGPQISKSVLALAQQKAIPLISKRPGTAQAASVSQADLQSFITSTQAAFGNLEDSGWNDWFTQQVAAREADILNANVDSFLQSVVQNLAGQGINPTSDEVQAAHDLLVADLQTALNQVVSVGLKAIEQQILAQISSAVIAGIQPQNRYVAYAAGVCDGIALGAAVFGAEPVSLFFATVGFGLWAFDQAGFFD